MLRASTLKSIRPRLRSRGGKLSSLVAGKDPRVKGLLLLDPVDNTPMTPAGEGYPTSLPGLRSASANRGLPVLVVGAAENTDVIPESGNYKRFTAACQGPTWEVDVQGAGHLAFLDKQVGLFSLFSSPGSTPDASVRAVSKAVMLAWLNEVVCPGASRASPSARISSSPQAQALSAALQSEAAALRSTAPLLSSVRNLERLAGAAGAQSSSSSSSTYGAGAGASASSSSYASGSRGSSSASAGAGSSSSSSGSAGPRPARITESYEQLMAKRAKELKAMLVERGVACQDIFEKEQLARRLIERCS